MSKYQQMQQEEPFDLFMCCLGNGTTVCNKAVIDRETLDYKFVAHISEAGIISWYVNKHTLPDEAIERIENTAATDRRQWIEMWDKEPVTRKFEWLLDLMTCAELAAFNQWLRHVPKPRDLKQITDHILNEKMCSRAHSIYGL